ncbi:MAG: glutathione S-transferase family protein, partial [Deltaproteobacteria bacterium]|nr:glutathione S-transferase family protein [Deltaproteobacteria bacterium]
EEAKVNSTLFLAERLPAFLRYFERALDHGGGEHLVGGKLSYVDLSMFQTLAGLEYAFPNGYARAIAETPGLAALRGRVAALPRIAAYLESDRRIPFNEHGIFRRYPELDAPPLA